MPSSHVAMTVRIASASSIVNQPPCRNLAIDAMKNMNMIMGNTIANSTAANLLRICHRYTVTRIDVMIIVIVSAKP